MILSSSRGGFEPGPQLDGHPTRLRKRDFKMKRIPWLFCIAVLVGALFVGSCGDGDQTQETLTLLFWQAPTIANPYLSYGTKDTEAAALVLESLAIYNDDGELVPRLAASIPTVDNGGVSPDRTMVTWSLKSGLRWSDGTPLTTADAVFTFDYACALPDGNCENQAIESVEALDDLNLQINFRSPQSYPYIGFVGAGSVISAAGAVRGLSR